MTRGFAEHYRRRVLQNLSQVFGNADLGQASAEANRGRLLRDPGHAAGMVVLRAMEAGAYTLGARRGRRERASR